MKKTLLSILLALAIAAGVQAQEATTAVQPTGFLSGIRLFPSPRPRSPLAGSIYYSVDNVLYIYDGSAWVALGSGGTGTPGGSTTQLQYNSASSFAGIASWTSDGTSLITPAAPANGGFIWRWYPTSFATQNGRFGFRAQQQTNTNDADRRDDAFTMGWNIDSSLTAPASASANSSSLSFESYYVTNQGVRQSETYFAVNDGLGHGHRWLENNFDIDTNTSNTFLRASSLSIGSNDNVTGFATIGLQGIISDRYQVTGDGTDTYLKAGDAGNTNGDIVLTPKAGKKINYQSSGVTASRPLYLDSGKLFSTGTFSGNTTTFATTTGTLTSGHVAAFDASGNIVDGGAGGSGCTVAGSTGDYQFNGGSGACDADGALHHVNSTAVSMSGGSMTQFIMNDQGFDSLRINSSGPGGGQGQPTIKMADAEGVGSTYDVGLARAGIGVFEVNNGTVGTTTGTKLRVGSRYEVGAATGVTVSGTSCTITAITGGIITAATCTP